MFRLFECCALSFFERFVLSFSLKIERFVSDSAEIWICGLYKNLNSVSAFQRIILPESKDIETIINSKEKPFYDFIKLLEKAQEFKKWKKEIPEEKNFIEEYTKAISKNSTWIERLPIKIMRFIIFESLGATLDMLGSNGLASLGLSSFDSFIIDKLIKRWKPNQFISNNLRKFLC